MRELKEKEFARRAALARARRQEALEAAQTLGAAAYALEAAYREQEYAAEALDPYAAGAVAAARLAEARAEYEAATAAFHDARPATGKAP